MAFLANFADLLRAPFMLSTKEIWQISKCLGQLLLKCLQVLWKLLKICPGGGTKRIWVGKSWRGENNRRISGRCLLLSNLKYPTKGSHQLKKKGILWKKFIKRWPPPPSHFYERLFFIFFCSFFDVKKTTFPGFLKVFIGSVNTLKAPPEPWKGN